MEQDLYLVIRTSSLRFVLALAAGGLPEAGEWEHADPEAPTLPPPPEPS